MIKTKRFCSAFYVSYLSTLLTRKDWIIYTGASSLLLWSYDSAPCPPPPPFLVSKSSLSLNLPVCRRSSLSTAELEVVGGRAAELYDSKKVWASTNRSILSALTIFTVARAKTLSKLSFTFVKLCFLLRKFRVHPEIKKRERKEWMGNSNRVYDEVTRKHFVSAWNSSWVHHIQYMIFSYKKICTSMSRHNYFYILLFFSRWGYFSYLCFLILQEIDLHVCLHERNL